MIPVKVDRKKMLKEKNTWLIFFCFIKKKYNGKKIIKENNSPENFEKRRQKE
jgi:hypothetical protein